MMIKFHKNLILIPLCVVVFMISAFFLTNLGGLPNTGGIADKYTDYKFWYIRRNDAGFIIEAAVRFYEGNYETKVIDGVSKNVYVRSKRLDIPDLGYLGDQEVRIETNGNKTILYKPDDFGAIKTDNELRLFLNKQIDKDRGRATIPEQSELLDISKVK